MPSKVKLEGKVFGRLTVISEHDIRSFGGNVKWVCLCKCNKQVIVDGASLRSGLTKSCGCYNKESSSKRGFIHGHSKRIGKSLTYLSWDAMINRCNKGNKKMGNYKSYENVYVCDKWLTFDGFLEDMGERPSREYTLDRFPDNKGNYEKSNCRWANWNMQSRNKKSNRWISYEGKNLVITDWANLLGTRPHIIHRSLIRGKTFKQIYNFYTNK